MPRRNASVARRRSDAAEAEMMTTTMTSQSVTPVDATDRSKKLPVMAVRSSLAMAVKSNPAMAAKSSLALVVKNSPATAAKISQVMVAKNNPAMAAKNSLEVMVVEVAVRKKLLNMVKRAAVATTVVEKAAAVRTMMKTKKPMSTVNVVVVEVVDMVVDIRPLERTEGMDP